MKRLLLLFFVIFLMSGCGSLITDSPEDSSLKSARKVRICHLNDDGGFTVIDIAEQSVMSHLEHGDLVLDADGDGHTAIGACEGLMDDCDDSNPDVYPGALELVGDGIDQDCNGDDGCGINAPIVSAGGPYSVSAGNNLLLQGTMDDVDLACNPEEVLTAKWYINGDQVSDFNQPSGTISWAVLIGLGLLRNITYDIKLVVTDITGRSTESITQLGIYDVNPFPCFTISPTENFVVNVPIMIAASCSYSPNPLTPIILYEWEWDASQDYTIQPPAIFPFTVDAIGKIQSYPFMMPGIYRVTLRITDYAGHKSIMQKKITVL